MTGLEPRADRAVRDAVDAFLEGRLRPEYAGETVFETKNSRYRTLQRRFLLGARRFARRRPFPLARVMERGAPLR